MSCVIFPDQSLSQCLWVGVANVDALPECASVSLLTQLSHFWRVTHTFTFNLMLSRRSNNSHAKTRCISDRLVTYRCNPITMSVVSQITLWCAMLISMLIGRLLKPTAGEYWQSQYSRAGVAPWLAADVMRPTTPAWCIQCQCSTYMQQLHDMNQGKGLGGVCIMG